MGYRSRAPSAEVLELSLEPDSESIDREKRRIRADSLARRLPLTSDAVGRASHAICARLLPLLEGANRVALFWPMTKRGEIDLRSLDRELRSGGVIIAYPWMGRSGDCLFRLTPHAEDLKLHPLGFLQPDETLPEAAWLDVIIVPALTVTPRGQRLGYGAGFYDRALARHRDAKSIAVSYDADVFATLPSLPHDVAVDWVVTELRTIPCRAKSHPSTNKPS